MGTAVHPDQAAPLLPRAALLAVAAVLAVTVLAVGWVRMSGVDIHEPAGAVVEQRMLRFVDLPDGGIDVVDAASGGALQQMRGEQGFLRGVLRGLARERRARGVGAELPFVLSRHDDGRLQLTDPATGRRIELASFGSDNAAVFLRWLPSPHGDARPSTAKANP
jgi:putative photosynthetic complex assembly protein